MVNGQYHVLTKLVFPYFVEETSSGRKKVIEESSQVNGGSFSMGFFPLVPPRNDFLELM